MVIKLKKPAVVNSVRKSIEVEKVKVEEKKEKKEKQKKLPPDYYKEEFDPVRIILDEYSQLNFSVRRGGEMGLPRVDVRHFATTELFTGFTPKGINFPLEFLPYIITTLQFVDEQARKKKLYDDLA